MNTVVLAMCGERIEGGWKVRRFAYLDDATPGERPREARAALAYMERLEGNEKIVSSWEVGKKPSPELRRFFDVLLQIGDVGGLVSRRIDYHAYPHCPSQVVDDGMQIYRIIKKDGVRPSNKEEIKMKKAKKARQKAKREALLNGTLKI